MANLSNVDTLLASVPDWRNKIPKRFLKFIDSYVKNSKKIAAVGKQFSFNEADTLSIFYRIEKALESIKSTFDGRYLDIEESKRSVLLNTLELFVKKRNKATGKMPELIVQTIDTLLNAKSVSEAAALLNKKRYYVMEIAIGRGKPRKDQERGALFYLKKIN